MRNWIKSGHLAAVTLPGSGYQRVTSESVQAILEAGVAERSHAELFAAQDDVLVALTTNPPRLGQEERAAMRTLPPWRAVMMARLAVSCGVMDRAELDALIDEAREVGGAGTLSPLVDARG